MCFYGFDMVTKEIASDTPGNRSKKAIYLAMNYFKPTE